VIHVLAELNGAALLGRLTVKGHGGGVPGHDIVCAAVSVLVRTAASVLHGRAGVGTVVDASGRGEFYLDVKCGREAEPYLAAVQDFLLKGIESLENEYPESCKLQIRRQ
jgi:uncharacterized protein YsxB (DUF464 family)